MSTFEEDAMWSGVVKVVVPFAGKLKAKMMSPDGKTVLKHSVRTRCPRRDHADESRIHWIHARIVGTRNHMHMACDDPACIMRMME